MDFVVSCERVGDEHETSVTNDSNAHWHVLER